MSQVQNKSLNEGKTAEPPGLKRPLSLWRNRDYVLLWSGQMVSSIGTRVGMLRPPLAILYQRSRQSLEERHALRHMISYSIDLDLEMIGVF